MTHRQNDFSKVHDKQRIKLPDDWPEMMTTLDDGECFVEDLKKLFNVSHSTLARMRREQKDFDAACLAKLKNRQNSHPKEKPREEIDIERVLVDLKLLLLSTTNKHDKRVLTDALEAFHNLRRDLRHAKSEAHLARERLHFRASGRASCAHATAGGAETQGLAASIGE